MTTNGPAIYLECAKNADETGVDGRLASFREQHRGRQVAPPLPETVDARWIEVDADEAAGCKDTFTFEQVEGEESRLAHQLAPVATETVTVAVCPQKERGFTQDAEIAFPAGHLGGVVE